MLNDTGMRAIYDYVQSSKLPEMPLELIKMSVTKKLTEIKAEEKKNIQFQRVKGLDLSQVQIKLIFL